MERRVSVPEMEQFRAEWIRQGSGCTSAAAGRRSSSESDARRRARATESRIRNASRAIRLDGEGARI